MSNAAEPTANHMSMLSNEVKAGQVGPLKPGGQKSTDPIYCRLLKAVHVVTENHSKYKWKMHTSSVPLESETDIIQIYTQNTHNTHFQ